MPTPRAHLFSLEQMGIKLGLDQIRALLAALDQPDRAFPSIIVAGTNGKGSVTAMIERGLRAAGLRTGRYTSPHLIDLEERFAVNGTPASTETVDATIERVLAASARLPAPPSFFEATTAVALVLFREAAVRVAVLEVGLGGRLDATNAVDARAAAITAVDFDHEEYLGHTLEAIAREKAGVIKPGALVVLGPNPPAVDTVVAEACETARASLVRATDGVGHTGSLVAGRAVIDLVTPRGRYDGLTLALRGRHQIANAITAVRLLEELDEGIAIPATAIRAAVEDVTWPGRLEVFTRGRVEVLIDGAHNPAGARALAAYVRETYGRLLPFVVGIMRDKQAGAILAALAPSASRFVFTAAATGRAARPADLAAIAARTAPAVPSSIRDRPTDALADAAAFGDAVVVAGSLYLAGEIRAELT